MTGDAQVDATFIQSLIQRIGPENVVTGPDVIPFATDVYRHREWPLAVARPPSVDALREVVALAYAADRPIIARGGGASYTDGYLPSRPGSLLIDTGRLNAIVEINEIDGFVTVEAGVTWAALKAALDPLGLRTPFFGPFSGLAATIGGSVSQNAVSHGSGAFGISAQSVLSLDVVTAEGALLRTGSAARGAPPHHRHVGPDLTGLFTGDCGALGIKARITLPLLRARPAHQYASFAFPDLEALVTGMGAVTRERLEDECFAFDAALAQGQIGRQNSPGAILSMARAVLGSSPSLITGLAQLARMALAGTRALSQAAYMAHFILDGVDQAEARAKLHRLRAILGPLGREIPNTIAAVVHAMPFAPLTNTLGPRGERWVPLHGIMTYSRVPAFHEALGALYARHAAEMTRLKVWTGSMFSTIGTSGLLYEVALYWPGARSVYHDTAVPAEIWGDLPRHAHDPEAAALIETLKGEIIALYARFEASHFQIGKMYPYADVLDAGALDLVRQIKRQVDPKGLMNPDALGL